MADTERRIEDEKRSLVGKKQGLESDTKMMQEKISTARDTHTESVRGRSQGVQSGYIN